MKEARGDREYDKFVDTTAGTAIRVKVTDFVTTNQVTTAANKTDDTTIIVQSVTLETSGTYAGLYNLRLRGYPVPGYWGSLMDLINAPKSDVRNYGYYITFTSGALSGQSFDVHYITSTFNYPAYLNRLYISGDISTVLTDTFVIYQRPYLRTDEANLLVDSIYGFGDTILEGDLNVKGSTSLLAPVNITADSTFTSSQIVSVSNSKINPVTTNILSSLGGSIETASSSISAFENNFYYFTSQTDPTIDSLVSFRSELGTAGGIVVGGNVYGGTIVEMAGFKHTFGNINPTGTAVITNNYGLKIDALSGNTNGTNNYGVHIDLPTTYWGLYSNNKNYMGDGVPTYFGDDYIINDEENLILNSANVMITTQDLGSEIVKNVIFEEEQNYNYPTDWFISASNSWGFIYDDGIAWKWFDGSGYLSQSQATMGQNGGITPIVGNWYKVSFRVLDYSVGTLTVTFGGYTFPPVTANGTYSAIIRLEITEGTGSSLKFQPAANEDRYKVADISIKEVSPTAKLQVVGNLNVQGSVSNSYKPKTANYTLTDTDYLIDCTANSFDLTLPTAVAIMGRVYVLKNSGSGIITVDANSSELIDGELTQTLLSKDSITIQSTGSGWIII